MLKVPWDRLQPGQIVLGGISVNGGLPPELTGFPPLTQGLIRDLNQKYHFLQRKQVLVAEASGAYATRLGKELREAKEKIVYLNECRNHFQKQKSELDQKYQIDTSGSLPFHPAIEKSYLKLDRYNSFDLVVPFQDTAANKAFPSLFHNLDLKILFSDILAKQLQSKFHIPDDRPVVLHLGVDYSFSISDLRRRYMVKAVNDLCAMIQQIFQRTKIHVYAFSSECREIGYPISGKELEKKETCYDSFFKKALANRQPDMQNKMILITDGAPGDLGETLERAAVLKRLKIDYTQIILSMNDEERERAIPKEPGHVIDGCLPEGHAGESVRLSHSEFDEYKKSKYHQYAQIAEIANGNQIIADIHEYLGLLSIQAYDRYMGANSLHN